MMEKNHWVDGRECDRKQKEPRKKSLIFNNFHSNVIVFTHYSFSKYQLIRPYALLQGIGSHRVGNNNNTIETLHCLILSLQQLYEVDVIFMPFFFFLMQECWILRKGMDLPKVIHLGIVGVCIPITEVWLQPMTLVTFSTTYKNKIYILVRERETNKQKIIKYPTKIILHFIMRFNIGL